MKARHTQRLAVPGSPAEVRRMVDAALSAAGATEIQWSPDGSECTACYGSSFRSWGERVTVSIDASQAVTIQSVSTLRTTFADWGKNQENCQRIAAAIRQQASPTAEDRQRAEQRRESENCTYRGRCVPNYYLVLEVAPHARQAVVERAYKALMMEEHPDRGGDTIRAQLINEAFEVLGDATSRSEFNKENGFSS